ncbi:M23 family metallopeptidase [Leptospira ilyithenensis]|nr:M23 family metallopeptidase [Leptospira ilyithenensis]
MCNTFEAPNKTIIKAPLLKNTAVGLGVSYDKQAGWGGRLGIGSATTNASISFSQRGNTTISGSANIPGVKGLQLTASSTTNGATTVGANYNAGNGPREGWNVGANYDINGGGFSGSVGYTDPNSGLGLTSTVDGNGLSTSAQVNGVNLATNGPDGFNMDEMNWSEQNINLAQDRGKTLRENEILEANGISDPDSLSPTERNRILGEINAAAEYKQLRDSGKTDAEIAAMSRDQREAALDRINGEVNPETLAIAALASVGTFFGGALAYMGLGGGTGNGSTPPVRGQVVEVPARRREDGEDDAGLPVPDGEDVLSKPIPDDGILGSDGNYHDPNSIEAWNDRIRAAYGDDVNASEAGVSNLNSHPIAKLFDKLFNALGVSDSSNPNPTGDSPTYKISSEEREMAKTFVLQDKPTAQKYIDDRNLDAETKAKLKTELDIMKSEWDRNAKTEAGNIINRNLIGAFMGHEIIQAPNSLPVYKNENGAIIPFPEINSEYGPRDYTDSPYHYGIDSPVPIGTPVPVTISGTIKKVGYSESWGNYIIVENSQGAQVYAHLSATNFNQGDPVKTGDRIGLSGNSGYFVKDGVKQQVNPHFHYGVFTDSTLQQSVNPETNK